jgi:hypothetical protein
MSLVSVLVKCNDIWNTEDLFIVGLGTAKGIASSVALQLRCRPLYGEQSGEENTLCCVNIRYDLGRRARVLEVDCVWNVMAHAQKPDFVFRRNGRVHLNRRGRQFSRLLAAEVCASTVVMLDTPCPEVVWEYWLPTRFASFPFTSPPVRHRVPSGFKRTLTQRVC